MRNSLLLIFFSGMLAFAGPARPVFAEQAIHSHASHTAIAHQSASNPLVEEMMILDSTYREVVSAVALGDNARVRTALEAMHGTMEKTHEGMHSGSVTIPRNAARVNDFMKMDKAFHEKLEALDRAALHNKQKELLRVTKLLLDGCVQCHQVFRK
jgi:cytochrome c556